MSDPLYAFPTVCGQTLRALARYPSRVAFSWPGGSITYQGATELQEAAEGELLDRARADGGIAVSAEQLIEPVGHPLSWHSASAAGGNDCIATLIFPYRRVRSIASR